MDMGGDSVMPTAGTGLSDIGMNMSNYIVASDFLTAILDDKNLQPYDWAITGVFWYGIVVVVFIATIVNFVTWATLKTRIRAAAAQHSRPAQASNPLSSAFAALTTITREISYPQISLGRSRSFGIPPFGIIILVLTYLSFVLGLEFLNVDYDGAQYWEARGLRAGWLTVAQFPLLILLAGKNNLLGYLVGVSYERLQVLHRWVSRVFLLSATLHGAYQAYGWKEYGLLQIEISTDSCIPTGFATWILLIWLIASSTAVFRNRSYEFFVVQHVISFIGFLVAVFYHIPGYALNARIFIWLGIGFFLLDRIVRYARSGYNNSKPSKASLASLPGYVTKVTIRSPRIKSWKPGQHVFLCIPRFGAAQSHPATIASVPSSHNNELIFLLQAHKGFTKRIHNASTTLSTASSLTTERTQTAKTANTSEDQFLALIDGPYGASYSDFAAFDTAVLIAGSTGVTFTLPILLDITHRASSQRLPLRNILFVWMIKSTDCAIWIVNELQQAAESLHGVGIELAVQIYITCDPSFTEESSEDTRKCGCDCDVRLGPCCCETEIEEVDDDDAIAAGPPAQPSQASDSKVDPSASRADAITSPILPATKTYPTTTITTKPSSIPPPNTLKSRIQAFASLQSGRPDLKALLWKALDHAHGEAGVAVCGPAALNNAVRNTVASVSDQRGASKGTGAQGVYLHCEGYYW